METNDPKRTQEVPKDETNTDVAARVSAEPEEELDELQQRIHDYPDQKWNLLQRLAGAAMGVICGLLLTLFSGFESIGMYATVAALLIALLVPRLAEKRFRRSVQKGRIAMLIALAVWLAAYAAYMLISGVPFVNA